MGSSTLSGSVYRLRAVLPGVRERELCDSPVEHGNAAFLHVRAKAHALVVLQPQFKPQ